LFHKLLCYNYNVNSGIYFVVTNDDALNQKPGSESGFTVQRRSFYVRLVKKAVSRGEQPDFKLVHVVGTLMMQNSSSKSNIIDINFQKNVKTCI